MEEADGNGVIMPPGDICHYFQAFMGFPGGSAGNESAYNAGDPGSISWVGRIRWKRDRLLTPVFLGFPGDSAGKEFACNVGDLV